MEKSKLRGRDLSKWEEKGGINGSSYTPGTCSGLFVTQESVSY